MAGTVIGGGSPLNTTQVLLKSEVMTAPHHGGNNGSSNCFICAVTPNWVIFSSGHDFDHTRQFTAERYLAAEVALDHLLRTDGGDAAGAPE